MKQGAGEKHPICAFATSVVCVFNDAHDGPRAANSRAGCPTRVKIDDNGRVIVVAEYSPDTPNVAKFGLGVGGYKSVTIGFQVQFGRESHANGISLISIEKETFDVAITAATKKASAARAASGGRDSPVNPSSPRSVEVDDIEIPGIVHCPHVEPEERREIIATVVIGRQVEAVADKMSKTGPWYIKEVKLVIPDGSARKIAAYFEKMAWQNGLRTRAAPGGDSGM